MLAKFGTTAGGATWWSNFELIQVEPHTIGQMAFYLAGEITQVKESIPWVRCVSGNVYISEVYLFSIFDTPILSGSEMEWNYLVCGTDCAM